MPVNIDLSSSDAWDDTSLVDTWNEALKEYKVSIKTVSITWKARLMRDRNIIVYMFKGNNYLKFFQRKSWGSFQEVKEKDQMNGETSEEDQDQQDEHQRQDDTLLTNTKVDATLDATTNTAEVTSSSSNTAPKSTVPDHLLNSDESMKNLMMAWYWAGYYTGYHDGEKASKQTPAP